MTRRTGINLIIRFSRHISPDHVKADESVNSFILTTYVIENV